MRFETFDDAADCLEATGDFLDARSAENTVLLGVLLGLRHEAQSDAAMMAVTHEGAVAMVAAMTPPFDLILSSGEAAALDPLIDGIRAAGLALPGVVGPAPIAEAFADRWQASSGAKATPGLAMRLYRLTRVEAPRPVSGALCQAGPEDLSRLSGWVEAFYVETGLSEDETAKARALAPKRMERGEIFYWRDGGRAVAIAGFQTAASGGGGGRINMVYTPPEGRNRGYGSACVAGLCRHLLDGGWSHCLIFADAENQVTNRMYSRLGGRDIGGYRSFSFARA